VATSERGNGLPTHHTQVGAVRRKARFTIEGRRAVKANETAEAVAAVEGREALRKRCFKACAIREPNATGIGIVEYVEGGATVSIHSLYYPTKLSNKDTFQAVIYHVMYEVGPDDVVMLRTSLGLRDKREWRRGYNRLNVRGAQYRPHAFEEPLTLAGDAIKRGTTIQERFEGVSEFEPKEIESTLEKHEGRAQPKEAHGR
jgi:hypothetical protein